MDISQIIMGSINNRPMILFPKGWAEGWADPDIEDGTIPLTIAEAYLAHVSLPPGERSTFPFVKIADMKTAEDWRSWHELYYYSSAPCPFGYANGKPLAPHGMSAFGVPKLHPEDTRAFLLQLFR